MEQILSRRWPRWRWFVGLSIGLLLLVAVLPRLCQYNPARRWLLTTALGKVNGEVTVERASFGWFSPPALYGLQLGDPQGDPLVTLAAAAGDRSLLAILAQPHTLGTFQLKQPHLYLTLREDGGTNLQQVFGALGQPPRGDSKPSRQKDVSAALRHLDVAVIIRNAGCTVQRAGSSDKWEVGGMNFAARLVAVESDGAAPHVEVAGGPLLERTALTPGLCNDVLKFVVPILADVATAEGEVSITLEPWRIPLDHPDQSTGGGQLTIHVAKVGAGPLARELVAQFGMVDAVEIVNGAEVKFQMRAGRVYHEGLAFGLPGYRIRTSGSVGLDESLDLVAEVPIPLLKGLPVDPDILRALSAQTVQIRVRGTLEKPSLDIKQVEKSFVNLIQGTLKRLGTGQSRNDRLRKDGTPSGDPLGDFLNLLDDLR